MSERHPAHVAVRPMEDDVADVGRWADVIRDLGCGDSEVSRSGLFVIGRQMQLLALRLDDRWKAAFTATGGQA